MGMLILLLFSFCFNGYKNLFPPSFALKSLLLVVAETVPFHRDCTATLLVLSLRYITRSMRSDEDLQPKHLTRQFFDCCTESVHISSSSVFDVRKNLHEIRCERLLPLEGNCRQVGCGGGEGEGYILLPLSSSLPGHR